jgi:hypothetical protein
VAALPVLGSRVNALAAVSNATRDRAGVAILISVLLHINFRSHRQLIRRDRPSSAGDNEGRRGFVASPRGERRTARRG